MKKSKIIIDIVTMVCFILLFPGCTLGKDAPNDNVTQSSGIIADDGSSSLVTDENGHESVTAEMQASTGESEEAIIDTAEGPALESIASESAKESIHTIQSVEESDETIELAPIELSTVSSDPAAASSGMTESFETGIGSDIVITEEGEIILPLAP